MKKALCTVFIISSLVLSCHNHHIITKEEWGGVAGDTNTGYDPTGHLLISVNGNYEEQEVTEESYRTLVNFAVKMARKYDLPLEHIKTHRDYTSETVCPGENLYDFFRSCTFYRDVEVLLTEKP